MKIKDILKFKGPEVDTLGNEKSISETVEILAKHSIRGLLVLNETNKIDGIIFERDIPREHHKNYGSDAKVKDIMTENVAIGDQIQFYYI